MKTILKTLLLLFILAYIDANNLNAQKEEDLGFIGSIIDTIDYPGNDSLLDDSTGLSHLSFYKNYYSDGKCDSALEGKCTINFSVLQCYYGWRTHLWIVTCFKTVIRKGPPSQTLCKSSKWLCSRRTKCTGDGGYEKRSDEKTIIDEYAIFSINSIYPNPVNDAVVFKLNIPPTEDNQIRLLVSDMSGQVVEELKQDNFPGGEISISTDFNHLPNGVYAVSLVVNGEHKAVGKMIIAQNKD